MSLSTSTESMDEPLAANYRKSSSLQPLERLNVDGFLKMVGEFGTYQILLDGVFCLMMLPFTFHVLIMFFAAQEPEWRCVKNSTHCNLNGSFTSANELRCHVPRSEWEYTEPESFSIVTEFDIHCDTDWMIYMTTSILFIGWLFGAIVLGWMSDKYGRKKVLFTSTFMMLLCSLVAPFVNNIYAFIVMRFLVGFFIPGGAIIMFILISEIVGSSRRALAGIILWFFFTFSLCLLGLTAYFIREWKTLFLVCTAPYFVLLLFYYFVPESVRWLRLQGRLDEALEIFETVAKWNGRKLNPNASLSPVVGEQDEHRSSSPRALFKTRRMAIKTALQGFVWMVNGMVYYGISLASDDLGGSLYVNYVLVSVVELPAALVAIDFCERFGRRLTTSVSLLSAGILTLVVSFVSANEARVALGIIGKLMITISFDCLYTWSVELYPTNIRSEAMGFLQITSRVGAASAPWIAKAVRAVHSTMPFIIMGVLGLLAGVACLFLPETKGHETQETENDITEEVFFMKEMK